MLSGQLRPDLQEWTHTTVQESVGNWKMDRVLHKGVDTVVEPQTLVHCYCGKYT